MLLNFKDQTHRNKMKNKYYLYMLPLCAVFLFNGKKYDELVTSRLNNSVSVCLGGQSCGATSSAGVSNAVDTMPVKKVQL